MRNEKQYHFIYKTTNILSGRYYIGMHSTDNLDDGYLGSGLYLKRSLNKHGKENHQLEILEFCKTREELKSREIEIVNLNEIAKVDCMNLKVGGEGGFLSKENQYKRSVAGGSVHKTRLKTDNEYYIKHCETFNIIRKKYIQSGNHDFATFLNKKHSDETKKKIGLKNSIHQKGINNSQYGTCWITNEIINKKIYRSDEIPTEFRLGRI
jgi:hypothetical protein